MENDFLTYLGSDDKIEGRCVVSIGARGTSKSYSLLKYINLSLTHNLHDLYILILPSYNTDNDTDNYKFLKPYLGKKVLIYTSFNDEIPGHILKKQQKAKQDKKNRVFLAVDDSTGEDGLSSAQMSAHVNGLRKLLINARHLRTTIWLITHSGRTLSNIIRQTCDILLIHRINNMNLLKVIWSEWLSMKFKKFDDFLNVYMDLMKEEYQALYLNCRTCECFYDWKKLISKFNL